MLMKKVFWNKRKRCRLVAFFFQLSFTLVLMERFPKASYKELIHENTMTIPTSTNMLISKSPHAASLETVFTHLKSGSFHNGGRKNPPWWSISPLHSLTFHCIFRAYVQIWVHTRLNFVLSIITWLICLPNNQ